MFLKTLWFWLMVLATGLIFAMMAFSSFRFEWKSLSHKISSGMVIMITGLLISVGLYWHWGAWPKLNQYWQIEHNQAHVKAIMANYRRDPQQLIDWFTQRLVEYPADAQGWYYLGKLFMGQANYAEASQAYQKALHLKPHQSQYRVAYAEALFAQYGELDDRTRQQLQSILKKEPDNGFAENLLAMDAYQRHDYSSAVIYWQHLAQQLPPESDHAKQLYEVIAKAQAAKRILHDSLLDRTDTFSANP